MGARQQRQHGILSAHGKEPTHGKDAIAHGKGLTHANSLGARQRLDPQQRRTTHDNAGEARQRLCRPYVARRTAKGALPGMALSCDLCRASAHDNAFTVFFVAFAVPLARTAKHAFSVVSLLFLLVSERNLDACTTIYIITAGPASQCTSNFLLCYRQVVVFP
jgi:hypothetical protein